MVEVYAYDLDNYPDNPKKITVELSNMIPINNEGDEEWMFLFTTTGYSNNTTQEVIPSLYLRRIKYGWYKSSGLVGNRFNISTGINDMLNIKVDNSLGADGNGGYYTITLSAGNNLTGEEVADDIETKIRNIPNDVVWNTNDASYESSYKNISVSFEYGKFWIVSGRSSSSYTGVSRTSVDITKYSTNTCFTTLGFDLGISSETIAGMDRSEVLVSSSYTSNQSTLVIEEGLTPLVGDAMYITDGTNEDYFTVLSVSGTTDIGVATSSTNGFTGISNNYTSGVSKVQLLRWSDSDVQPYTYYDSIDKVVRIGIKNITRRLDFSS